MPDDWIETTVGAQATLQRGVDITRVEQRDGNVPVISSGGVSSYHDTPAAKGPGVVLGRKGVVGSVYFVESDYWPHDTTLWVKDFHGNDPRFVYYFFRWIAPRIATMDVGSANPTLNRNHVHPIEIRWPPPTQQRAIAHILGTLDDKIELNRRMGKTLNTMARALFKSWFVDFDPVRAKAEGRYSQLPESLDHLFPDGFTESEIGEIPRGWEIFGLDQIGRFLNGLALQKYPAIAKSTALPVIKIAQLRAGHTNGADKSSAEIPADYVVHDGDVLFSWSGTLECVLWTGGKGALNQHLFKVSSQKFPKWLYYLWIHQHLAGFRHIAASKATTMGHIQRHHLSAAKVVIPSPELLIAAGRYIGPLIDAIISTDLQSRTLREVRETLLPKLVAGEIPIEHPDGIVGGIA